LPSDSNLLDRVRKLLGTTGRQTGVQFHELERQTTLEDFFGNDPSKFFFYIEVSGLRTVNGRQMHRFVCELGAEQQFDMQFGRVLCCHLLNRKDRLNWKHCELSKEQQESLIKKY
jgi:hypothetical protein